MFECEALPQVIADDLSDAGVVDALTAAGREENAACARRLAWMGELYARRMPEGDDERCQWAIDGFENAVAEVSAALGISRGRAKSQLDYAIALRERLPRFAEVFATGAIDFRLMSTVVARTDLVEDAELLARLDAALARHAPKWMKLSSPKLAERIDVWVAKFDPAGVRVPKEPTDNRYVEFWANKSGMATMSASIPIPQAEMIDRRLDDLAATVCPHDPRTKDQRRTDALSALAAHQTTLACGCGAEDCPAATGDAKPLGEVVIHVLAEQATIDGTSDTPGYSPKFGPLPAEMVRDLADTAKLKPLTIPSVIPESGYRPSQALAEFVRARDLTCRFPGCDCPGEVCELDHTIPWPLGPTHPSNLKLLCKYHHLLKTFWTGLGGWADRQLPDGTVIWTAPTGHTYATAPGGAIFFSQLATPTGELIVPTAAGTADAYRGLMMPARKETRAESRRKRIAAERQFNEQCLERRDWLAEELQQLRACLADDEPPPF